MRNEARRVPVKRLFLLGAGASHAASKTPHGSEQEATLDNSFVKRVLALEGRQKPRWISEAVERVREQWIDRASFPDLGLEEAIARHLGHVDFLHSVHPKRRAGDSSEWLKDIVHLMCWALQQSRESAGHPYQAFADKVFGDADDADAVADRVITFNYDTLLDQHLIRRFGITGTYFDRIKDRKGAPKPRPATHPSPVLVKMHGSVNWRCDISEIETLLGGGDGTPHFIDEVWVSDKVPSPKDDTFPLMIPPIPTKPLTKLNLFTYLWTKAYEYLYEAEEVYVCGYSMPPADRLASSMFANFKNDHLKKVVIVDPDAAILTKWRNLLARQGIAKGITWEYVDDFAELVQRL